MDYLSAAQAAKKWKISERSVRNYCAAGRVEGAFLTGKTWHIPENAEKPERANKASGSGELLQALRAELDAGLSGGIYHKVQIELTYNSNHIEGSCLTQEQTRFIFETSTVYAQGGVLPVDDIIETRNHFKCIDMVIREAKKPLTQALIKRLHFILKSSTAQAGRYPAGEYKKLPNTVGGLMTAPPELVEEKMRELLARYNAKERKTLDDLIDFHCAFERIHPFQDGNGRVGRLILFKECLKYGIVPFIIDEKLKPFYYRGLREWGRERGYLRETCLAAQDTFKSCLDYFRIKY